MNTLFYSNMASMANRLLSDKGQNLTVTREDGGSYDPTVGKVTGGITTSYTIVGAVFDVPEKQINGTSIIRGDKNITTTAAAASIARVSDVVDINGEKHTIVSVKRMAPAGIGVYTKLLVRKGS